MVAHRVNRERLVVLGWSRAILLQIAHPLIAAGVIDHSSFRGGALQAAIRLHHTIGAMLSLTFGTAAAHQETVLRIRAIHRTVKGHLRHAAGPLPVGTPYSAEDPALLLWVHATLLDSTADIYQRLRGPLGRDDLDALCREAAPLLEELGGDPHRTPMTWPDLVAYMDAVYGSGVLTITPDARTLADAVLTPRAAGLPVPLGGLHRLVSVGLLPATIRDAYGFRWDDTRQRRLTRTLAFLRRARQVTPPFLALWPQARGRR